MVLRKILAYIVLAVIILLSVSWMLPSWERMALPATATNITENEAGPHGITMDMLYELSADLTENEFVAYATKLKLRRVSEAESTDIRTLPTKDGERIIFAGDCDGSTQIWAVYSDSRMHYRNSVGY